MLHLCRIQKVILLGAFLCIGSWLSGQKSISKNYNYRDFQQKDFYFGFSLALNRSNYHVFRGHRFVQDTLSGINAVNGGNSLGFAAHMIGNMKFGEYFDFRVLPGFSLFNIRPIEYTYVNDVVEKDNIESFYFELPLLIRFKSQPYKDKRVYLVTGLKYSYDVSANSKTRQEDNIIQISPHDFQYEIGLGMQFFYPYFIFSPEIKFSQGLGNILIQNQLDARSNVLEKILSRILTFSFNFEG